MRFKSVVSTEDGRLTSGKVYYGSIVRLTHSGDYKIVVFDDTLKWNGFDVENFVPYWRCE